jgi:glucose-1-phosphate cytidylyltransferase
MTSLHQPSTLFISKQRASQETLVRAVILAGGMGTRLREETEYRPKPMVEVGGRPILWHIMKNLAQQGLNDFVICLGYKGDQIRDFFLNYESRINDVTIQLGKNGTSIIHGRSLEEDWRITLADTGLETMTGGRLHAIRHYIEDESFLCTYGDGLSDVNLSSLLSFHSLHGKLATVTAVRPITRFGALEIDDDDQVLSFAEKPRAEKWINGGFFIFEPGIFQYLDENSILEREPLERVAKDGQLKAFRHEGFWQPMDTYREMQDLNSLWNSSEAPWKNW